MNYGLDSIFTRIDFTQVLFTDFSWPVCDLLQGKCVEHQDKGILCLC